MYTILNSWLGPKLGKKKYQALFEKLHQLSLMGMNIGNGASVTHSGEKCAIEYINRKLTTANNLVIFDVGANVGHYSIELNEIFNNKAQIFCFEPSTATYKTLVANTDKISSIKQYNFGFGNETTTLTLYSNAAGSGLASVYARRLEHFNIQMNKTEEIEIKTIDEFCAQNNIAHIHFLKLDVEGHELKVLEGAKNMLCTNIDFIQFEFGGCNIDSRTFFQDFFYLLKDDYFIYRIVRDGLCRVEKYKEMYEAFVTTNYLAERKTI